MPLYDPVVAASHLSAADARLAALIERVGTCGLDVGGMDSPFRSLLRAIVYQQLSGKAAGTIYGRLENLFADRQPGAAALLALSEAELRAAGLSRAKAAAAADLAARALDGTIPTRAALDTMEDRTIIDQLTVVRGVGPWTVQMLLIFELGRPDVLPATDLGVRRGISRLYGLDALPTADEVALRGTRWRPYRSVASWYLWRAADMSPLPA